MTLMSTEAHTHDGTDGTEITDDTGDTGDIGDIGEGVGHDVTGHARALPAEEERVMDLLHEHVPLALLCDLVDPDHGLDSTGILAAEGSPDDHWWEPPTHDID